MNGLKGLKRIEVLISLATVPILLVTGMLTGCQNNETDDPPYTPPPAAFPLTITDQAGRTVTIDAEPQRIVSLSPGITENLFSLGLGDRIIGVTDFCDYPEEALAKTKVGGFSIVNLEKIVEVEPDLILAGDIHMAEVVPTLEDFGFTIIVLEPTTLNEVMDAMTIIGKVSGNEDEAEQLISDLEARIKAVTDKTSQLTTDQIPDVLYILWHDPVMSVGTDTRIHELIVLAGGNNITEGMGEGYPILSIEAIIDANPQVIIAGAGHGSGADATLIFAETEELLAGLDARVNDMVYGILADIVSRPSERLIRGLEVMAQIIHPEIFGEVDVWN